MTAILNFIKGIAKGIQTMVSFVADLVSDTAYLVSLLAEFVSDIPEYFSFFPAPILAMIGTIFTVVVVLRVLGRD